MSYFYDGTTAYHERTASVPTPSVPFSMSIWIKITALGAAHTAMSLVDNSGFVDYFALRIGTTGTVVAQHRTIANGSFSATSAALVTAGNWFQIGAVFASGTSRSVYVNGVNKVTDTNTVGAFGNTPNVIRLAARTGGSPELFNGRLAYGAMWPGVALSDSDMLLLASNPPSAVQSGSLTPYYPLDTNQGTSTYPDSSSNHYDLTDNGATFDSDNPVFTFVPPPVYFRRNVLMQF